jgi:transcriptional regulator with XRE-family HTH domain
MIPEQQIEALYRLIGKRIAHIRSHREQGPWSQSEFASAVGLSRGSIANIELGTQRPPIHTFWQIAVALDIEPRLLLPTTTELEEFVAASKTVGAVHIDDERLAEAIGDPASSLALWINSARSQIGTGKGQGAAGKSRVRK